MIQDFIKKTEKSYDESSMSKYFGACFECCDFEKTMNEIKQFYSSKLQEAYRLGVQDGKIQIIQSLNSNKI